MKSLELTLKERLLIVEMTGELDTANILSWNLQKVEQICYGSELTKEIAKDLVHTSIHTALSAHYVKDIPVNTYCYKSALESFISAIEAAGHHWGENPLGAYEDNIIHGDASEFFKNWQEAQAKTFNLSQSIIFKF